MRSVIIAFALIFLPSLAHGQLAMDSLWTVWEDETKTDSLRLDALHTIYFDGYLYSKPDSALFFAQLALDYASSKALQKEMAIALYSMGVASSISGNHSKAIDFQKQSLNISENIKDLLGFQNRSIVWAMSI